LFSPDFKHLGIIFGVVLLALVSWLDDVNSMPSLVRFGCQAMSALLLLWSLEWPGIELSLDEGSVLWSSTSAGSIILFLWLVGYTNAFNFMDGINGLAAGQAVVTGTGMALLAGWVGVPWSHFLILLSLVIAASAAGFLPRNFPTPSMFMGDVGSAPLGFLLASLTICIAKTFGWWLLVPLALLHANFVLDTLATLARRIVRGERWYSAHREHFYQRLVRAGKSHTFVTLFEMSLQVLVLGLMILYLHVGTSARLGLIAAVVLLWLGFFAYCEVLFQRSSAKRGIERCDFKNAPAKV